jgi:hypothetical protein
LAADQLAFGNEGFLKRQSAITAELHGLRGHVDALGATETPELNQVSTGATPGVEDPSGGGQRDALEQRPQHPAPSSEPRMAILELIMLAVDPVFQAT